MSDWGLRGRYFRRFAAAWIIVMTSTAALLDEPCCCCGCGGWWNETMYPELDTVDPIAQERIRSSEVVRAAVGGVSAVSIHQPLGVTTLYVVGTYESVYKINYDVVGASGTMVFVAYVVERAGQWVVEALESADGAHVDGTVPQTSTYSGSSGGGGGWD